MTALEWFCIGGPLHGQWRSAGSVLTTPYLGQLFVYYPCAVRLPGWRASVLTWSETSILRSRTSIPFGAMLPGSLANIPSLAELPCRWCYGRPTPGQETCSRVRCITAWEAVRSLETTEWRGEER